MRNSLKTMLYSDPFGLGPGNKGRFCPPARQVLPAINHGPALAWGVAGIPGGGAFAARLQAMEKRFVSNA
jgi:hypothetical protein